MVRTLVQDVGRGARSVVLAMTIAACTRPAADTRVRDREVADPDHDGVVAGDRCPTAPEDVDGWDDADGCPDPDNDADRVGDASDACPDAAEDADGWEDGDGCPDPDNDRDRILDGADACPDDPELYNGYLDDDGCPDPIAIDYEPFTDYVFVPEPIGFATDDAAIAPAAADFIVRFARWLRSEPAIELIGVIGHAEPTERDPRTLSRARADAVVAALVRAGISASRLVAHGAGTTPAREWAHVPRPAGADRSVHFRWFRTAGKTIYRWDGAIDVPARAAP